MSKHWTGRGGRDGLDNHVAGGRTLGGPRRPICVPSSGPPSAHCEFWPVAYAQTCCSGFCRSLTRWHSYLTFTILTVIPVSYNAL